MSEIIGGSGREGEEVDKDLGYLSETINTYNNNVERFIDAIDEKILSKEMDTFCQELPEGSRVLDAGCGYGRDSELLAKKGYEVEGVDLAQGFIEEAKKRFPDTDFQIMDIRELGFPDESFNGIWARAVLLHLTPEDIEVALREMSRVLAPGGILFVYMKKGEGSVEKEESFTAEGKRFFTFFEEEQLSQLIQDAGLTVQEIYPQNEREVFGEKYRDLWWICAFARKENLIEAPLQKPE